MRPLLRHVLTASCVSALTAGAVVGGLTSTALPTESVAVAAPLVLPKEPAERAAGPTLDAIAFDRRLVRESQVAQRAQLLTAAAAGLRHQDLVRQQQAHAKEQHKLEARAAAQAQQRAERAKQRAEQAKLRAAQAQRAKEREAKQRAERAKRAEQGATSGTQHDGGGTGGSPRAVARRIMSSKYGWGSSQFSCYNNIIIRESGWRVHAANPSSSAYGIPQALPGSKMASAGPDWRNNAATQIKWGLGYVKSRYGTPCGAWSFKRSHGWY